MGSSLSRESILEAPSSPVVQQAGKEQRVTISCQPLVYDHHLGYSHFLGHSGHRKVPIVQKEQ